MLNNNKKKFVTYEDCLARCSVRYSSCTRKPTLEELDRGETFTQYEEDALNQSYYLPTKRYY